jgi:uncharacterized protein YjbI with pentapeptide repeats
MNLPNLKPLESWTPQERWVWKKVCAGDKADFNGTNGYEGSLDPKGATGWVPKRQLRQEFLDAILLREPFRSAVTRKGVCIEGAWFVEPLDLMQATITVDLFLDHCRFEDAVFMANVKTAGLLSFQGSKFADKLNLNGAQIQTGLYMRDGAEFVGVELKSAKVGGHLDLSGSKFVSQLNMNGVTVQGILAMSSGAEFTEVDLVGAQVVSVADMRGSTFKGALRMNSLKAGQLVLSNSSYEREVKLDSFHGQGHVFIRYATFSESAPLIMDFASIGANLDFSGSTLSSVSLIGAQVRGSLVLGQKDRGHNTPYTVKWHSGTKIILSNASVGALQDLEDAWPSEIDVQGFAYDRLGSFGTSRTTNMAMRDLPWLTGWLARQKMFSPSPYVQLAGALVSAGYREKGNEILFAGKERERTETTRACGNKVWLTLQKLLIGYGYRIQYSIYWVLLFIVLGVVVLKLSGQGFPGLWDNLFYSTDMLMPILDLDKQFSDLNVIGWAKYYFYIHKTIGFILGSFIVAGLSGLTKYTK